MAEYELFNPAEPTIFVTPLAMHKMRYYIDNTSTEIGWLGYVQRYENDVYLIEDVFLVKQQVHSATTELDADALGSLATDLIKQGDKGIALYNKIRLWGHSHVNMSTSPSGQDDKQMEEFGTADFYIRLIGNKKGEWNVCLYDYEKNILWSKLEMQIYYEVDIDDTILEQEIKDNVSTIKFENKKGITPYKSYGYDYNKGWSKYGYSYYDDYMWEDYDDYNPKDITTDVGDTDKLPYIIDGRYTEKDLHNMRKYYSSDIDECLFMATAPHEDILGEIYVDFGVNLSQQDTIKFQKDMTKIFDKKYGINKK